MIHHRTNFAENQAKKIIQEARYVKHRSFYEYSRTFGSEFTTELESLSLEAVWIDMGAGVGRALKDYFEFRNRFGKSHPQLWGVSKQDADFDTKEFSVRWLGGRYFEEIKANEFPASLHLVTDYFGVLSYTAHVSEYLNFVFDRMPIQGKFFAGRTEGAVVRFALQIVALDGRACDVFRFFFLGRYAGFGRG